MIEVYEMIYAILGDDPSMLNFHNLDSALWVLFKYKPAQRLSSY